MIRNWQVNWFIHQAPKDGEKESGDGYTVNEFSNGYLISVIDGLGHGKEAYIACHKIIDFLYSQTDIVWKRSLEELFISVNNILKGTRGVVMSSLFFDTKTGSIEWAGVGNVEGIVFHKDMTNEMKYERLVTQNGIIGFNLPHIYVKTIGPWMEVIFLFYTDGLSIFGQNIEILSYKIQYYSLQKIIKTIFDECRNPQDDALIWVGKFSWIQ